MTKETKTWRIVNTDNHDGDYPDEYFMAIGICDEETAKTFADAWNERFCGDHGDRYARVVEHVEHVYQLAPGFQP